MAVEVDAGLTLDDGVVDAGRTVDEVERACQPSAAIRSLSWCGRSSVIQPVSAAFIRIRSVSNISCELVRVIMFRAALAMLVCG